jgi:DNA polymerase III delta prime subunit
MKSSRIHLDAARTSTTEDDQAMPPDWRSVTGLESAKADLLRYLVSDRAHPVVVLTGTKGVGKRHLASWMAAHFFCENRIGCGSCPPCLEVMAGRNPDVIWVARHADSSMIKTAEIEAMQEHLHLKSPDGYRVAVIADCDQISIEAQNRLLKTLEEPDEQTRIILTTSRPGALLPTVLGRCLKWRVAISQTTSVVTWWKELLSKRCLPYDEAEQNEILERFDFAPGALLRLIESDEGFHQYKSLKASIRKMLFEEKMSEGLQVAEELARQKKADLSMLMAMIEWELCTAHKAAPESSSRPKQGESLMCFERRKIIRNLRRVGIKGQVLLNTQLALESLVLAGRFTVTTRRVDS